MQKPKPCEIHGQPAHGDGHHRDALDGLRLPKPAVSLNENQDRNGRQRGTVGQCREDLCAVVTVGPPGGGWTLGDPQGEQAQTECGHVGEHVPGVGQQGQRIGKDASGDFGDHVSDG